MPLVLHNSDVSGWALQNQATPYSQAIAERLKDDRAKVPALWELELSNVLRSACVRQRLHAQAAHAGVDSPGHAADRDRPPSGAAQRVAGAGPAIWAASYDASYLELALRPQWPLATQDTALRDAAMASGVGIVAPAAST